MTRTTALFTFLLCVAGPASAQVQTIGTVQGAAHRSPAENSIVSVEGVVTLLTNNGFFMQDAGDGDTGTSDGIFVFTSRGAGVSPDDRVLVEGRVVEFQRDPRHTPLTELAEVDVEVLGAATPPAPTVLGAARPTEVIDDDALTVFEPTTDGLDFYESLEGMRVAVEDMIALEPANRFGEVWGLANAGQGATGFDGRSIVMSETDRNPERVLVDFTGIGLPDGVEAGSTLGTVVGVIDNSFGKYRLIATEHHPSGGPATPPPPAGDTVTVAVYNVENLDPKREDPRNLADGGRADDDVGDGKFAAIAAQIVRRMGAPAILALQEVQDNDGAEDTSVVSADETLSVLADAIAAEGGPIYRALDLPPEDDRDGGQPGGNIRVAYLYDPSRAVPVAGGARRILDPDAPPGSDGAFASTRKPVLAVFQTIAGPLTLINVHLSSRGGSDPSFGAVQPPTAADAENRRAQTAVIGDLVFDILEADIEAQLMVLGDFNAFTFEEELTDLENVPGLENLWRTLPETDRRSYVFEGQGQTLDHVLVSPLLAENTTLEAFHINAGRRDAPSDHDPLLVTIAAETPEPLPEVVVDRPPVADTPPVVLDPTPAMTPPTPPSDLAVTALRDWLKRSWYDGRHRDLGYKQARIEMYSFIDVAEDGRVFGVYSGFSQAAAPVSFLNPINAEHTQPQSTFNQRLPMRSDIHHLFPTHMTPNQARGREPFGEIPDSATEQWFSVDSAGRLFEGTEIPSTARAVYGEDRDGLFEPPEAQKGDTARALFYFHTMYPGLGGDLSDMGDLATLGAWHRADPPDAREIARNARVETVQGNRNPFVDVPELACRVFARTCP